MANPFQYTVQSSDYGGLNAIARRFGYQNYQQAGITGVPSGNFDLIRPGDVINFGNAPRPAPAIASTAPQWNEFNNATDGLNGFMNAQDPYMQLFQQQREANKLTADNAIASATAANERATMQNEQEKNATEAGLATAALKTGLAPNSQYQTQVIQGARDQFNTRFALLDQQEKLAVAKAKAAQQVGDTAVLAEQLEYAQKLRQEKARAMEEAQKMEWEKYKFEHLSAAQQASENRLGAAAKAKATTKDVNEYTDQELRKLRAAGIDPTNLRLSDEYLYGETKGTKPLAAGDFTRDYVVETYGKDKIYNLAKALGVAEMTGLFGVNWSKNNEIKALFDNTELASYVQQMLADGYSIDDIIASQ